MEIKPNLYQFIGKAVMLLSEFLIIIFLVWNSHRFPSKPFVFSYGMIFFGLVLSFLLYLTVLMIFQFCFLPFKILIDTDLETLEVHYLVWPAQNVKLTEIEYFNTTKVSTKSTTYPGILIKLSTGQQILIDDISLVDYLPVEQLLRKSKIKDNGNTAFNDISYYFFL